MAKFRVLFKKEVYAYTDIEAENKESVEAMEEDLFGEEWESDSFNYPDGEWEISKITEVKK